MARINQKPRKFSRYLVKRGRQIIHGGITEDFDRRKEEHERKYPGVRVVKIGPKVTEDTARKWEKKRGFTK